MATYPLSRRDSLPPPPSGDEDSIAGRIGPEPTDYDALADMFLGELGSAGQRETTSQAAARHANHGHAAAPRATVELLLLGHLPVMAAAWASHYVRHLAGRTSGPVASLRLADGTAWLELFNSPAGAASPSHGFSGAMRTAAIAPHWIIRTDPGREPELIDHQRISQITLLTGCNEAATVDAYRAIKQLVTDSRELPPLRIAVLGGTPAACRQAADRICDACQAFLEIEVHPITCPGAIGAGAGGLELYHGRINLDQRLLLDRIGAVHQGAEGEAPAQAVNRTPAELVTASADAEQTPSAAAGAGAAATLTREEPEAFLSGELPRVEDLGLRPLDAACPYETGVLLATDEAGGLHLLVQCNQSGQIDAAVRALSVVAAWASDHRRLLAAAGACDQTLPIQRHLLTDSPREARRLLDTDIRVHLCASTQRAQHGWILADLN